jgi:hypothetical protein
MQALAKRITLAVGMSAAGGRRRPQNADNMPTDDGTETPRRIRARGGSCVFGSRKLWDKQKKAPRDDITLKSYKLLFFNVISPSPRNRPK